MWWTHCIVLLFDYVGRIRQFVILQKLLKYLAKYHSNKRYNGFRKKIYKKFYHHTYLLPLNPVTELAYQLNRCPVWNSAKQKAYYPFLLKPFWYYTVGVRGCGGVYREENRWEFRENHADVNAYDGTFRKRENFIQMTAVLSIFFYSGNCWKYCNQVSFHEWKNPNGIGYKIKIILANQKSEIFQLSSILGDDTKKSNWFTPWSCNNKRTRMSECSFSCWHYGVIFFFFK